MNYANGWPIIYIKDQWVYEDTKESLSIPRACRKCGDKVTEKGHDTCIANLPGIRNGCCGHSVQQPYLQFEDEETFRKVIKFLRSNQ